MFIILSLNKETVTKDFYACVCNACTTVLACFFYSRNKYGINGYCIFIIIFFFGQFFFVFCNVHVLYNKIIHVYTVAQDVDTYHLKI